jgi:AcrR family transcriptional regulator
MKYVKTPASARRSPSQVRARESVAVILEASAQVLQQHGYKAATTNRIAERAGVSVGTIYQYFGNKDEIFDALIEKEAGDYLAALRHAMPEPNLPLDVALRVLLQAGYSHHRLILGLQQVMYNVPHTVYADRSKLIRDQLHQLLIAFLSARNLRDTEQDYATAADLVIAMCEGMTFLGRVERDPMQLIDLLTDASARLLERR